jgi:signal transduction histidine kinase
MATATTQARRRAPKRRLHLRQAQFLDCVADLTGDVVHNLNNTLSPVITSTELLRPEVRGREARRYLNLLHSCAWDCATIVRRLLDFTGGVEMIADRLDFPDIMAAARRELASVMPAGIFLSTRVRPGLWPANGDAGLILRTVLAMGLNARDAIAPGRGRIAIEARNTIVSPAAARDHAGARAGRHVVVTVSDNGCGIPADHLPRVFDPFFTTRKPALGRGLGLSSARGIVRLHGGFIQVLSAPGAGSEFRVHLPAARADTD